MRGKTGRLFGALLFVLNIPLGARAGGAPREPPRVYRMPLPELKHAATGRDWADLDAAPAAPPSALHPRGTVVVAQAIAFEPSPSVTEWDVADGSLVRSAPLPLPASFCELRIVRARDSFHRVAAEGREGRVVHLRLGPALDVARVDPLGIGERPRLATDGSLVAVLWVGPRSGDEQKASWELLTYDAAGERLGEARLGTVTESTFLYGNPLAVAGRRVFVLVPDGSRLRVEPFAFDARGCTEPAQTIPWSPDDGRLFAAGDRVYFTDDCRVVEVAPRPPGPAPDALLLPGAFDGARACTAFEATADGFGRFVTTAGDVVDARLRVARHFADPAGIVVRALWLGGGPALIVAGGAGGRASIVWSTD
jgi:hypothetical protein